MKNLTLLLFLNVTPSHLNWKIYRGACMHICTYFCVLGSLRDPPCCTKVPYILLCFGPKIDPPPLKRYFCTKNRQNPRFFSKISSKNFKNSLTKLKNFQQISEKKMEFFWKNSKDFEEKVNFSQIFRAFWDFLHFLYKSTIYTFVICDKIWTPPPFVVQKYPGYFCVLGPENTHPIYVWYFCWEICIFVSKFVKILRIR